MIKVGDTLPATTLMEYSEVEGEGCSIGPNAVDVAKATAGKTIALFALPGAFTPTCSAKHVPGYVASFDAFKAAGVDEIWCVSVNDAFVMGAWARDQQTGTKVRMLGDGDATFAKATGLTLDLTGKGLGLRSNRYSMLVKDGKVATLNVEGPGKFELSELIEYVCNLVTPKMAEKKLSLNLDGLANIGFWPLLGDRDRLQQIFLTLITNAIKFTAEGSITIRGHAIQEGTSHVSIRFEVQDTGIGISKEARTRLFFAFEQADNSITRKYGGTGLGLAITRRLAELMGGEAGVSSTLGHGSTFWFHVCLPIVHHHNQSKS